VGRLYLGLVSDEVDFGFGRLCRRWCRDDNIGLLLRFLHEHIDEGLLLVLRLNWDYRRSWGWWSRRLDEHDFIVFLWGRHIDGFARSLVFVVWRWHVDVYMLMHYGLLLGWSVLRSGRSIRTGRSRVGG
jgi:hypothetical protein